MSIVSSVALVLALGAGLSPQPVTLEASDGVIIRGDAWVQTAPKAPTVLLFHQAGSSRGEYATIGPWLHGLGYHVLAIDQRSGGSLFSKNETARAYAKAKGLKPKARVPYLDALPDLEAAYAYAKKTRPEAPIVVWGSSYSAALVFLLAASHSDIKAVLAFSPGEYLGAKTLVQDAAKKSSAPALIMTPHKEHKRAAPIAKGRMARTSVYTPDGAVHGSSMLIDKKSKTAASTRKLVEKFLKRTAPTTPQ